MKIYVLFGQRHENYPGELAPEALAVIDEFTHDENPQWMAVKQETMDHVNEFVSTEVVAIDTGKDGFDEIKNRLAGRNPEIDGTAI